MVYTVQAVSQVRFLNNRETAFLCFDYAIINDKGANVNGKIKGAFH